MLELTARAFHFLPRTRWGWVVFALCVWIPLHVHAQQGRGPKGRSLRSSFDSTALSAPDLRLTDDLGRMISSNDMEIYDPITISTLRRLKDEAQPPLEPDYVDPATTQKVVEKALAMQSIRNMSRLLQRSELRTLYRDIRESFRAVQDFFKLSVKDDGKSLVTSPSKKGEKLLEFSLELNAKRGFDPELRFSDSVRMRYDLQDGRPMLEYGVDF